MDEKKITPEEFLKKVRAKYPEYNNVDDKTALKTFLEKYPSYEADIDYGVTLDNNIENSLDKKVSKEDEKEVVNYLNNSLDDSIEKKTEEILPAITAQSEGLGKEREDMIQDTIPKTIFDDTSKQKKELSDFDNALMNPKSDREIYQDELKVVESRIRKKDQADYRLGLNGEGIMNDPEYHQLKEDAKRIEENIKNSEGTKILKRLTTDENVSDRFVKFWLNNAIASSAPLVRVIAPNLSDEWYNKNIGKIEEVTLQPEVEKEVLRLINKNEKLKQSTLYQDGFISNQDKEKIIKKAKSNVFKKKYTSLQTEANDLVNQYNKLDKDDPQREKISMKLDEVKNQAMSLYGVYNIDSIKGRVENTFKSTTSSENYKESFKDVKGLDVVSSGLNSLGQGVTNFFLSGSAMLASFGDMFTDDKEYSMFDALGDLTGELAQHQLLPSSNNPDAQILKSNGDWNLTPYSIARTTFDNIGRMIPLIAGLKSGDVRGTYSKIGGLLSNTNRAKKIADGLMMGERAYKMDYIQNYTQAKQYGLDSKKSFMFAQGVSGVTGLVQLINPETEFFKTSFGQIIIKNYADNLKKAVSKEALKKSIIGFGKELLGEVVEEETEGALQELTTMALVNNYSSPITTANYHKQLIASTVFSTSVFAGVGLKSNYNETKTEFYKELADNHFPLNDQIDDMLPTIQNKKLKKALIESKQNIADITEAISKSPENVTGEQIDLLIQKKHILNEMKTKDDSFHPEYKEKIEKINEKIRSLNKGTGQETQSFFSDVVKGIVASNNKSKVDNFLSNLGDTKNNYNYEQNAKTGETNKEGGDKGLSKNDGGVKASEIKTEKEFKEKLENENWITFSPENPENKKLSPEENKRLTEGAKKWLDKNGYDYKQVKGKYDDEENLFIVFNASREDAVKIAKYFNQESVAHNTGSIYQDGSYNPRNEDIEYNNEADNHYSEVEVNGKKFKFQTPYDLNTRKKDSRLHTIINNLEDFNSWLDKMDEKLVKFNKENLSSTIIPTPIIRGAIKAIKTASTATKNGFEALSAGIDFVTSTKWYKGLSKADKREFHRKGLLEHFDEAEKELKKTGSKTSDFKKTIRKITGQVDQSEKIVTTEAKMLKEKFKNLQRGYKTGTTEIKKLRTDLTKQVKKSLKILGNQVSKSDIKRIMSKIDASNLKNISEIESDINNIIDMMDNRSIKSVNTSLKKTLKKKAKSKSQTVSMRNLAKRAVEINSKYLTKHQLIYYNNLLGQIKDAMGNVLSESYKTVNIDTMLDELDILENLANEGAEKELGLELLNGHLLSSDTEFKEFMRSLNKEKREKLKEKLVNKASEVAGKLLKIKDADLNRSELKSLKNVNFTEYDSNFLRKYIRVVDNIVENQNDSNAYDLIAEIESLSNVKEFVARVSPKTITDIKSSAINDLKSLTMIFKTIFGKRDNVALFNKLSGLSSISKNNQLFKNHFTTIEDAYFDVVKKAKKKNKHLLSPEEVLKRAVIGQLIQGSTPQDFEINKSRIEQHIERLRKYKDKHVVKMADKLEAVYNELASRESQSNILDYVKSANDGNFEMIDYWLKTFDNIKDRFKDNTEYVHGIPMPEFIDFYLPIKTKLDPNVTISDDKNDLPIFMQNGIGSGSPASASKERTKSPKLPKNRELDLNFDDAMFNKLSEMLQDIYMSKDKKKIKHFFEEMSKRDYFARETSDLLIHRINEVLDSYSGKPVLRSQTDKVIRDVESVIRKIGVKMALGTITQYPKQYISVATHSLIRLGKNAPILMSEMFKSHDIPLLDMYSVKSRAETQGGTEYKSSRVQEYRDSKYIQFSKAIGKKLKAIDEKADKYVFMSLRKGDTNIAKATWVAFYKDYLKRNNIDIKNIDMKTEHTRVEGDKIREEAVSYAESMVEETQVASDSARGSLFFNGDKSTSALILRSLIMPYQRFNVNGKMRMIVDTQNFIKAIKLGDKEMGNEALQSFGATVAEQAMFQGLKIYLLSALMEAGKDELSNILGLTPDDDSDEEKEQEFKNKKFISAVLRDTNPIAIGSTSENLSIEILNWIAYLQDDNTEGMDYFDWEKSKMKTGDLPFYRYGNKAGFFDMGFDSGLYATPINKASELVSDYKYAFSEDPKVRNKYGRLEEFDFDENQRDLMKITFLAELTSFIGMEMETVRAFEKLRKRELKRSKVKKSKGKKHKSVFM